MGNNTQTEELTNSVEKLSHTQRNFILKVMDTTGGNIKKALKEQGIEVVSLMEIHKESVDSQ
jgi:hypothetical protein